jgi:hypothetical protein
MKAKLLSVLIILIFVLSAGVLGFVNIGANQPQEVSAQYSIWQPRDYSHVGGNGAGDGSAERPFLIGTAATLNSNQMRDNMRAANRNFHFVLIADINLRDLVSGNTTANNWTSIPLLAAGNVFDGNNYAIRYMRFAGSATNQGFFHTVDGTVRNLTFEGVHITGTRSPIGVAAGIAQGSMAQGRAALFSRVSVQSSTSFQTGGTAGAGGIVGNVQTNGFVRIEYSINRINMSGTGGHAGGILGRVNASARAHVTECANYGNITSTTIPAGTGGNGTGGIVGCSESNSATTIEWCYNRGNIHGHAGIFGQSNGTAGDTSIMNTYHDGAFTGTPSVRAGIGTLGGGSVTASNNWFRTPTSMPGNHNHAFVQRSPANQVANNALIGGQLINGRLHASVPNTPNVSMHTQAFVDLMNMEHTDDPIEKFVLHGGTTQLLSLIKTDTVVLRQNDGSGAPFIIHQRPGPGGTTVITLPEYTREDVKATIGTRLGYKFAGWRLDAPLHVDHNEIFNPGDEITLAPGVEMFIFDTHWEKLNYKIEFIGANGGELFDGTDEVHEFQIWTPDVDNTLTIRAPHITPPWPDDMAWMALRADTTLADQFGWVSISRDATIDFHQLINENSVDTAAFFQSFIDQTYSEGGFDGIIRIRLTDQSIAHIINVTSNYTDAGRLDIKLDNGPSLVSHLNDPRGQSLPNGDGDWIENLQVIPSNNYYKFVGLEIRTPAPENRVVRTINAAALGTHNFLADTVFNLGAGPSGDHMRSNWTIHLNWEREEFDFLLEAELHNGTALPSHLIEHVDADTILIGEEDVSVFARASATTIIGGVTYQFSAWKMYRDAQYAEVNDLSPSFQIGSGLTLNMIVEEVDYYWLDEFLNSDTGLVRIVAEYVRMFNIVAFVQEDENGFSHGTLEIYVDDWQPEDGMLLGTELIPEGSAISIRAIPNNNFYEVDSFGTDVSQSEIEFDTLSFEVTRDRNIAVSFKQSVFNVTFTPVNLRGSAITRQTSIPRVNGIAPGGVSLGGTISTIEKPFITGYQFEHFELFTFNSASSQYNARTEIRTDNFGNLLVTEGLLSANMQGERFVITAVFSSNFSLRVEIPNANAHMGNFEVFVNGVSEFNSAGKTNKNMRDYFDPGAEIVIVAHISNDRVFKFDGFTPSSATLVSTTTGSGRQFNFALDRSGVTIRLDFAALPFTIGGTLKATGGGETFAGIGGNELEQDFTITNATVNNQIQIIAEADANREVKVWRINGVRVQDLARDLPNSVTREGNTVTITLTAEWLARFDDGRLDSSVEFGYTTIFLLLVIGLPSVILTLGAILAVYFVNLQRKKKLIKKYLLADKAARANFNQADIVSGAREGKDISGVSKAAIKAAMKAEKAKAKGNPVPVQKAVTPKPTPVIASAPKPPPPPPQAPKPATPPPPPPQKQIPKLAGTKMLPDRTIVDNDRNVVAVMRQDGTIVDRQGKAFAKIRMTDGAVIDINDKILGMVQGDGTIS